METPRLKAQGLRFEAAAIAREVRALREEGTGGALLEIATGSEPRDGAVMLKINNSQPIIMLTPD